MALLVQPTCRFRRAVTKAEPGVRTTCLARLEQAPGSGAAQCVSCHAVKFFRRRRSIQAYRRLGMLLEPTHDTFDRYT